MNKSFYQKVPAIHKAIEQETAKMAEGKRSDAERLIATLYE